MKRKLAIAILAISLAAPAYAVAPLAAMLISYVKQALKDKLISYAKEKASGLAGEALADVPGAGMLGMAAYTPSPAMSAANTAALQAAGFNDTSAKPFTDAEWQEYQASIAQMYKAAPAGMQLPDFSEMRAAMASMPPQMLGMLRTQLRQFQQMRAEQAEMRKAWDGMSEPDRQEVVAELAKAFRDVAQEDQPYALRVLKSGALGLPDELAQRLLLALKA